MHEEQKEPKYYRIRADILWSAVALIIVACIVGALHFRKNLQSPEAQSTKERVEVTCDNLSSQLKDINQCCLCGDNEISLMGYYRKFDTIGLISLNDWYVLDFRLKEYDENGNEVKNSEGVNTTFIITANAQAMMIKHSTLMTLRILFIGRSIQFRNDITGKNCTFCLLLRFHSALLFTFHFIRNLCT